MLRIGAPIWHTHRLVVDTRRLKEGLRFRQLI